MLPLIKAGLIGILTVALGFPEESMAMSVGVRGFTIQHEVFSVFARPGEALGFDLPVEDTEQFQLYLDGVAYGQVQDRRWTFKAPANPGHYQLQLNHLQTHERFSAQLFVGVPANAIKNGELNHYRIGDPPPGNPKYPQRYRAPVAFYEVTPENIQTRLSPHFTLEQFVCKQASGFPKYLVLQESLLVLLEGLISAITEAGYPVQSLATISGYRTPHYNAKIGNVANSRHVYGDAYDFYVDVDGDGRMDDLNGDGELNAQDVDVLANIVEAYKAKTESAVLVGGVGRYYPAAHHGGFVHVDTRGYRARW